MNSKPNFLRRAAKHLPVTAAILGMMLVFASVLLLYFGHPNARIITVSIGMIAFLGGMWYAANPFIKNERRFLKLRAEVDQFIALARDLNRASRAGDGEAGERLKAAMHESVERIGGLAGKEDAPVTGARLRRAS